MSDEVLNVREEIIGLVKERLGLGEDDELNLTAPYDLDSLDFFDLSIDVEQKFGILLPNDTCLEIDTPQALIDAVESACAEAATS